MEAPNVTQENSQDTKTELRPIIALETVYINMLAGMFVTYFVTELNFTSRQRTFLVYTGPFVTYTQRENNIKTGTTETGVAGSKL